MGEQRLLAVERVSILHRVPFFAELPGRVLADVALVAEEVDVAAGTTVISEGEVGDSLYVVAQGTLRVEIRGRAVAEVGPGEVVGELAALVPEPRSASVVAATDALLLTVAKPALDELLVDRPEIAYGIITTLVRRFQQRNAAAG